MKNKIIGISGKIGSGKDTFAEELAKIVNKPVQRHAFADKLRTVTQELTGYQLSMTHEAGKPFYNAVYNYSQDDKNVFLPLWGRTVGECLQVLGTEGMRNGFDSEVWVKALLSTSAKDVQDIGHILVIPDVRFPNEADAILEAGGVVIRLEGDPMKIRENSTRDLTHMSETALDNYKDFSRYIDNKVADIEGLRDLIEVFINFYKLNE